MTNPIRDAAEALEKWYYTGRSLTGGTGAPMEEVAQILADHFPASPTGWRDGYPSKPWSEEWFIAVTTHGDRVVLQALPEEYTYDFKTADDTYLMKDSVRCWMQFPDSNYIAPHSQQPEAKEGKSYAEIYKSQYEHWSNSNDGTRHEISLRAVASEAIRRAGIEVEKIRESSALAVQFRDVQLEAKDAEIALLKAIIEQRDREAATWMIAAKQESDSLRTIANENAKLAEDRQTTLAQKDARIARLEDALKQARTWLIAILELSGPLDADKSPTLMEIDAALGGDKS